ncbi:MAG: tRNA-dihydrouridine synthase [Verrucomicrobia bacterium]|nr:tRNA-dihydrouridine synthase [Verrucomicrobiota bacterium]MCH8526504.1 tRNA-dihydrouridine synthase [Kiritimatiellia bacterium]
MNWNEPFDLGGLRVPNRVLLSPLAGVSDAPFRRICQDLGAGLTYIEMLSAAGMAHQTRKTDELVARDAAEPILGAQITGPSPEILAEGARLLMERDLPVDTLDINMGCPVKKIVSRGCGSAIVRDPAMAGEMVRAAKAAVNVPVTAKIRIGFTKNHLTVEPVCEALGAAGAEMVIIHGRTRDDTYGDAVQYDQIRKGFDAVDRAAGGKKIWKIGNGNVFDVESARKMAEETGCDGVLISRGSLGNPWVFRQILENDETQPTVGEWEDVLLRHIDYHCAFYGEGHYAAIRFRKHLLWYVKGYPGAKAAKPELSVMESMGAIRERIRAFAAALPADLHRYPDMEERKRAAEADPKFEMDRDHDRGVEHYEE